MSPIAAGCCARRRRAHVPPLYPLPRACEGAADIATRRAGTTTYSAADRRRRLAVERNAGARAVRGGRRPDSGGRWSSADRVPMLMSASPVRGRRGFDVARQPQRRPAQVELMTELPRRPRIEITKTNWRRRRRRPHLRSRGRLPPHRPGPSSGSSRLKMASRRPASRARVRAANQVNAAVPPHRIVETGWLSRATP